MLRILAVKEEWFTDDLPLGEKSKVVLEQTGGVWIVEFPDLHGLTRKELGAVKSFAARRFDKARLAYGRRVTTLGRQWVGAATSNDAEYLGDNENRRWWPQAVIGFNLVDCRPVQCAVLIEGARHGHDVMKSISQMTLAADSPTVF
jgi:predicted P-loop ATPase